MVYSIALPPNLRRVIASIIKIKRYPPSNTGKGNKFITPKLTEIKAINVLTSTEIDIPDSMTGTVKAYLVSDITNIMPLAVSVTK